MHDTKTKPVASVCACFVMLCYWFLKLKALDYLFPSINSEPGARNINLLLFSRYYKHQSELTVWFIPSSESMARRHLPLTVSPPLLRFKFNQIWIGFCPFNFAACFEMGYHLLLLLLWKGYHWNVFWLICFFHFSFGYFDLRWVKSFCMERGAFTNFLSMQFCSK